MEDDFDEDFSDISEEDDDQAEKPSLKELWDNTPALKLIAISLAVIVVGGIYLSMSSGAENKSKAILRVGDTSGVKHIPGQKKLDPAYKKALKETNIKTAQKAAKTGGSALPTPIGISKVSGLGMSEMPKKPKSDPLAEWRKATEMRRRKLQKDTDKEEPGGITPQVVPLVQPIRPRSPILKKNPGMSKALVKQMRTIISAQVPVKMNQKIVTARPSAYTVLQEKLKKQASAKAKAAKSSKKNAHKKYDSYGDNPRGNRKRDSAESVQAKPIISPGTISYAQVLTEVNSDILGPVLAQVLSGPFAGGRAMGKVSVEEEYMVMTFKSIVKDGISYSIDAIAMDENTTLTGIVTDVDHHYFSRIILPAAASFIEGYGSAISEAGSTTTTGAGGETVTDKPKPSPKESLWEGFSESVKVVSEIVGKDADKAVTVKVAKGTTFGMLFLKEVKVGSVR